MSDTTICENCGDEVSLDDIRFNNDEPICNGCFNDIIGQEPDEV
jgi:formylmethanofuran dehydrogenase subunit E